MKTLEAKKLIAYANHESLIEISEAEDFHSAIINAYHLYAVKITDTSLLNKFLQQNTTEKNLLGDYCSKEYFNTLEQVINYVESYEVDVIDMNLFLSIAIQSHQEKFSLLKKYNYTITEKEIRNES